MQTVLPNVLLENRSKPFLGIRTIAHFIVPGLYHHEAHSNSSFSQLFEPSKTILGPGVSELFVIPGICSAIGLS